MKNANQHVIPACYLKAWCDPVVPPGQNAFIWRIPKVGGKPYRRSPEKSFRSTDRYTITLPNGERDLVIEHTLAEIEAKFVRTLDRVRRRGPINLVDKAHLCAFTAAMQTRTIKAGENWRNFQQQIHDKVVVLEQKHGLKPIRSLETAEMVRLAPQTFVADGGAVSTPLYFGMKMAFLITSADEGFITSDKPCVWGDPTAHRRPPAYRSPGLGHPNIEVTLPLTPQILMLLSHKNLRGYLDVDQQTVDRVNWITRSAADQEFISWKGISKPEWFETMPMPEDAWENTPEGKAGAERRAEYASWREKNKASTE